LTWNGTTALLSKVANIDLHTYTWGLRWG